MLLLGFASGGALGEFLGKLPLTHHVVAFNQDQISVNVALSVEGLRLTGFSDYELRTWPDTFYEGEQLPFQTERGRRGLPAACPHLARQPAPPGGQP